MTTKPESKPKAKAVVLSLPAAAIMAVFEFASKNGLYGYQNGVSFVKSALYATDGHALCRVKIDKTTREPRQFAPSKPSLPALRKAAKAGERVSIRLNGPTSAITFADGSQLPIEHSTGTKQPDYERVFPKKRKAIAKVQPALNPEYFGLIAKSCKHLEMGKADKLSVTLMAGQDDKSPIQATAIFAGDQPAGVTEVDWLVMPVRK